MKAQDLLAIAQTHGEPTYVYDAAIIATQYKRLTEAFSKVPSLRINYACKALSNISVLQFIKQLGSGLDAVSLQEVELGLQAGFAPHEIIFTPNGVSLEEIETYCQGNDLEILSRPKYVEPAMVAHHFIWVGKEKRPPIIEISTPYKY